MKKLLMFFVLFLALFLIHGQIEITWIYCKKMQYGTVAVGNVWKKDANESVDVKEIFAKNDFKKIKYNITISSGGNNVFTFEQKNNSSSLNQENINAVDILIYRERKMPSNKIFILIIWDGVKYME